MLMGWTQCFPLTLLCFVSNVRQLPLTAVCPYPVGSWETNMFRCTVQYNDSSVQTQATQDAGQYEQ